LSKTAEATKQARKAKMPGDGVFHTSETKSPRGGGGKTSFQGVTRKSGEVLLIQ